MRITFCQVLLSEADPECLQHLRSSLWQYLHWKPFLKTFVSQSLFLDGSRSLDPSLIKYCFTITISIASSINRIKLNKMTVACVKLKVICPNIVIRRGSGMSAISKMELFVAIALHWKPLTFVVESSILDRREHAI